MLAEWVVVAALAAVVEASQAVKLVCPTEVDGMEVAPRQEPWVVVRLLPGALVLARLLLGAEVPAARLQVGSKQAVVHLHQDGVMGHELPMAMETGHPMAARRLTVVLQPTVARQHTVVLQHMEDLHGIQARRHHITPTSRDRALLRRLMQVVGRLAIMLLLRRRVLVGTTRRVHRLLLRLRPARMVRLRRLALRLMMMMGMSRRGWSLESWRELEMLLHSTVY